MITELELVEKFKKEHVESQNPLDYEISRKVWWRFKEFCDAEGWGCCRLSEIAHALKPLGIVEFKGSPFPGVNRLNPIKLKKILNRKEL